MWTHEALVHSIFMCCTLLSAIYTAQFINSPVDGHLKYFPFLTTRNNAALKISEHGSLQTSFSGVQMP